MHLASGFCRLHSVKGAWEFHVYSSNSRTEARSMELMSDRVSFDMVPGGTVNRGSRFQNLNMPRKAFWKRWGCSWTFKNRTWEKGRTRQSLEVQRAEEIKLVLHPVEGVILIPVQITQQRPLWAAPNLRGGDQEITSWRLHTRDDLVCGAWGMWFGAPAVDRKTGLPAQSPLALLQFLICTVDIFLVLTNATSDLLLTPPNFPSECVPEPLLEPTLYRRADWIQGGEGCPTRISEAWAEERR